MSVYPVFPTDPAPVAGDLFPDPAVSGESQFRYLGDGLGWSKVLVALEDPSTGYPVWPGRVVAPGGGGGG